MQPFSSTLLFSALLWPGVVFAFDADFSLSGGVTLAVEKSDKVQKAELFLKPHLVLNDDRWSAEVRGVANYNASDYLLPQAINTDTYSSLSQPLRLSRQSYLEIPELWAQFQVTDNWSFKAGKQVNNWGTLDEFRILDVLNPQQFREFIFEDLSRTRLGIWGVNLQTKVDSYSMELFVSSDETVHESPNPSGPFQFAAPEFRFGFPKSASGNIDSTTQGTDLDTYAVRVKGQHDSLDFSLVAFTGPDYSPVGSLILSPGPNPRPLLVRSHEKKSLYGGSLGTLIGSFVARVEYGFLPARGFNSLRLGSPLPELNIVHLDQHQLALGVDQQFAGNLLVTAQWMFDKLEKNPVGLIREQLQHLVSLGFRKPLLNEQLALKGRWVFGDSGSDGLVQISGDYALSDDSNLRIGVDYAYGKSDGIFGQFSDRTRLKVEYEKFF